MILAKRPTEKKTIWGISNPMFSRNKKYTFTIPVPKLLRLFHSTENHSFTKKRIAYIKSVLIEATTEVVSHEGSTIEATGEIKK